MRKAKRAFGFRTSENKPVLEVAGYELEPGEEPLRGGYFVRSTLLEGLKEGATVEVQLPPSRIGINGLAPKLLTIQVDYLDKDLVLHGKQIFPPVMLGAGNVSIHTSQIMNVWQKTDGIGQEY